MACLNDMSLGASSGSDGSLPIHFCSSLYTSHAVWKRCAGALAIIRSTSATNPDATEGFNLASESGLRERWAEILSSLLPSGKGGRPVSAKYKAQPSE